MIWRRTDAGLAWLIRVLIRTYQISIGAVLPQVCRFEPSCSRYASEAVRRHGALAGCWWAARRLLRCHPFHPGGTDPVP